MDELKTLKDIATAFVNGKNEIRGVREDELKKEAIKWIKSIMDDDASWVSQISYKNLKSQQYAQIDWIKHFFNITELELEDEN